VLSFSSGSRPCCTANSAAAARLLAAGRYAAENVQASELVEQGRHLGGFWVGISQLPRSHPWTVRRIWRLHQLKLFGQADTAGQASRRPLDVA
jgi:hypothetical protein